MVDRSHIYISRCGYYRHKFNIRLSCLITVIALHRLAAVNIVDARQRTVQH